MKRLGVSDSSADTNSFSKKHMVGPQIGFPWAAASSQPKTMGTPSLDMQRAESSRQHVRALNTQFASWVQSQLQNHPDELWEDGVRDYLTHASNILEKFSDVVNWLKSNSTKSENLSEPGSHVAQKKLVTDNKGITNVPLQEKTSNAPLSGPASMFATSGFVSSWSPRPLGNSQSTQSSFSFGVQSSIGVKPDASKDADGDDEAEQPSSPSVKKTEEIGISVVHEVKCKIYIKSTDPTDKDAWKDRGTGQLTIKCKEGVSKGTKDSKPTILVRNDVGRIVLNALLYPGIKTNLQKNSIVAIFHTADDNERDNSKVVARTFLIRLKTEDDRDKLATAIKEYAPAT
ncbi:putative Ran binding domain, PH-like domain superfamily [Helianthus annuus]|nr:putative Ran binding domain, PH-like domain superfamily [Helianthus annuus]